MRTMRLILVTTAILLAASFSHGRTVNDTGSPNFWPGVSLPIYSYRQARVHTLSPLGSEGISGAYFEVGTGIRPGGYLTDFNKVISITATHSPSGRTYPLNADTCRDWISPNLWPWGILLRPEDWMFEGSWSYTLVYEGSDKKTHIQIRDSEVDSSGRVFPLVAGPNGAFPPAISNIQIINTTDGNFQVSWSGIGDNPQYIDYSIQIFDMFDLCVEWLYRMTWRTPPSPGTCPTCIGTYDSALNRVSFIIPSTYSGRKVRLRQYIVTPNRGSPRAIRDLYLPE